MPKLLIIAGCNGSGKSSFSKAFTNAPLIPYDYDKIFKDKYDSLIPSGFRDTMAHNMARKDLKEKIYGAIDNNIDFCYETNFNTTPLYWPKIFKANGYKLEIVFFCLDSIEKAKKRVMIRFENGGHFVPDNEVVERYHLGFKNINAHWTYFDTVSLFETSTYNTTPKHLITIERQNLIVVNSSPKYLISKIPSIIEFIEVV
ncbi:hypothetical protein MHTCC0001_16210 [Flavobacteriaceae bacterium MHTCC 0001]